MFDEELERFKQIDLRDVVVAHGYFESKKDNYRGNTCFRHLNKDKIFISRRPDSHWAYWSARDAEDKGTVIDFLGRRGHRNLGIIRKTLREWCMSAAPRNYRKQSIVNEETAQAVVKGRQEIEDEFRAMKAITGHRYLEQERGIPALALQHWRWAARIFTDKRDNAIFAHRDHEGVCGWEIRNFRFRGFAPGGHKGLCETKATPDDRAIYFCESGIDAISLFVIKDDPLARFASVAGQISSVQPRLIKDAIERMPEHSEVVAAMDADETGRRLCRSVELAFEASRGSRTFRRELPEGAKDWNALLLSPKG